MSQTIATPCCIRRAVIASLVAAIVSAAAAAADPPARPNIVVILADDMGYSDVGCYGGEVRTPQLDALAAGGLRFTQFYNTGRCCPTRASLLTGLYPHQAGVGHMVNDRGAPGYIGRLNERCVTIAEVLRTAGYATGAFGKWHVTPFDYETGAAPHRESWPLQRGFDRFLGSLTGGGNYFGPKGWMNQNEFVDPREGEESFYYTDAVSDAAAAFITGTPAEKPLFVYVAYTAPHWPLHALEEDIAKYEGVYDAGWDAIRAARYERMKRLGVIDAGWALSPRDKRVPAWDKAEHHAWQVRRMQVYAAQIDRMDRGVGRIVESLRAAGRLDDTLILFLADNGGCEEDVRMPGIGRFAKKGQDTSRWGNRPDVMPGPAGTFASYSIGWANVSNTPFRWYKSEVHEGGIATPLIAHWPRGIAAEVRGKFDHQPGHLIDLMATAADLAGAKYPAEVAGRAITPMQGVSLRPAFGGRPIAAADRPLCFEHEGNRAVRIGKWKLVALAGKPWELYDMEADRSELHDRAAAKPEMVRDLSERWDRWAAATGVTPRPGK